MQAYKFKEMATILLMEALQAIDPKVVASLKQIMVVASQANGLSNGGDNVPSMSATFYEPSLKGVSSSTIITHNLRIMGKGFKWAKHVLVSIDKISQAIAPQQKIYSLDNMMMGSGFGKT
jgi:hypothetical protein